MKVEGPAMVSALRTESRIGARGGERLGIERLSRRNMMAWGHVAGGSMYLSQMRLPSARMERSKALPVASFPRRCSVGMVRAAPSLPWKLGIGWPKRVTAPSPIGEIFSAYSTDSWYWA